MIKRLYKHPLDTPRVNGHRLASHLQFRGLRQGCPLCPSLFALYIDPLLRILETNLSEDPTASLHAFADDFAIHSTYVNTLTSAFRVMFAQARPYGLVINFGKSELHARGGAPHVTIHLRHQGKGYSLSTINGQGEPHTHNKYLEVYFFYKLFTHSHACPLPLCH